MLVERGLQVMNVEAVGEAYAIASNYLRKSGAIPDTLATNERLLGDHRADVPARRIQQDPPRQQGDREIRSRDAHHRLTSLRRTAMEAAIDRIMQTYDLLVNRTAAASAEARAKVTEYSRRCSRPAKRIPTA